MDNNWVLRSANTSTGLMSVTYGNGKFVATGYHEFEPKIIYSFDGITWTTINFKIGFYYGWNAVIYANGLFVAGGQGCAGNATDIFATSPNGKNWTLRYADVGTGIIRTVNAITHGNGLFVAVGNNAFIQTSPDGINWTRRYCTMDTTNGLFTKFVSITYGNGLFIAITGGYRICTSPDGINWTFIFIGYTRWNAIMYGNGLFVIIGEDKNVTSPDGINWTERNTYLNATTGKYINNIFVALGYSNNYHTSSDGLNWTTNNFSESLWPLTIWSSIEYVNNIFVAVTRSNHPSIGNNKIITNGSKIVTQVEPLISNFIVPTKIFGESPITIVAPNSDSDGSFTYTSSDSSVAIISENIITIVGAGSTTITATQEETDDYTSGIITTTFIINRETLINPAIIENANDLNYFLNTTSKYGNIINTFSINNNLSSSNSSMLFSTNNIEITREI